MSSTRFVLVPSLTSVVLALLPSVALAQAGALSQVSGLDGCISKSGTRGACVVGDGLDGAQGIMVTEDGGSVYVVSRMDDAVVVLARDESSGTLTQLPGIAGCISEDGSNGRCTDGVALNAPLGVAASHDGKNVYTTSRDSHGVAAFARNRQTSALTQLAGTKGCVSLDGTGGSCAVGVGLRNSTGIAISPRDRSVYVAARGSGSIAVFKRNRRTGVLTQLGGSDACVGGSGCKAAIGLSGAEDVVVSPDRRHVYVASRNSDAVAAFKRNRWTGALTQLSGSAACISEGGVGGCAAGVGLQTAHAIAISPDGKNVYVGSRDSRAVAVFARNSDTGALTQLAATDACVSPDGGVCAPGIALEPVSNVTVSPDGEHVYVASRSSNGIAVFARDSGTGALTQLPGSAACISENGPAECSTAVGVEQAADVVVSRDNKHAYVAATAGDAVAAFERALP